MENDIDAIKVYKFLLKISKKNNHNKFHKYLKKAKIISINSKVEKKLNLKLFIIKTIIGQQVSVSAAKSIWNRVQKYLDQKEHHIKIESLSKCGLSLQKSQYIFEILNNKEIDLLTKKKLRNMKDNEISKIFLDLKGVGPWTLGIIKMFYIGNNDVFLDGDLGIKKSKLNFFKSEEYQAEEYSPYRTFLCLYLWQSLNS